MYHLGTCSTCKRIIGETRIATRGFELQDIKKQPISPDQLDEMKALVGSYEALFSRKSQQFRPRGLNAKLLTEVDYRQLILEEYTFLKRPVTIVDNEIFIGNEKNVTEALAQKIQ